MSGMTTGAKTAEETMSLVRVLAEVLEKHDGAMTAEETMSLVRLLGEMIEKHDLQEASACGVRLVRGNRMLAQALGQRSVAGAASSVDDADELDELMAYAGASG